MTRLHVNDPKELVTEHLEVLNEYATRVLLQNKPLTETEEADKARRIQEFMAIGGSFGLPESEIVALLCKELLTPKPRCGCAGCRMRAPEAY